MDVWGQRTGQFLERVMVFIDGSYWYKNIVDQFGRRDADLAKVVARLVGRRRLVRVYYYIGKIENPPDDYWKKMQQNQQRTLDAFDWLPYVEVRTGRLQFFQKGQMFGAREKGVDVALALDMLRFALKDNYDTAILIAGDGDFAGIVQMVKDEGRKVEVVSFAGTRARALLQTCDWNLEVTDDLLDGCWRDKDSNKDKE